MPNVAAALGEGRITAEHADVLVGAAGFAGGDAVDGASRLLDTAASTNVERTRRAANEWMHEHRKGLTPAEKYRRQRAQRRLSITQTSEGLTKATTLMDPATGAAFKAIIDGMAQRFAQAERNDWTPPAPLPPLAPDHLSALPAGATFSVGSLSTPATFDGAALDTCDSHGASSASRRGSASPADVTSGCASHAPSPTDAVLRRRNQLLIVADAQWRALVARDRGCVICQAAPSWCEAHHIVPWKAPARGRTDIDNLALLCFRYHHQLHDSPGCLRRTSPTSFVIDYNRRRE
ncbi:HNH endonuclease signature motif containing protein [Candidatus Poriferisodalis sp.]|uniref:HNH endonuclease signature motif containing protein n=1 Tax=Candidatus Poriferisodalis sp. TaxID=3101277 RepID=UPI003C6EA6BD